MAKSLVEKFEQILAADPTSMVFVELAKSLIERGDTDRAIAVCRDGVDHHPDSILGRVLLGRSLLAATQQDDGLLEFERALAIDPDNPYGYNLVAETMMQQRLFAQATPVLEKALVLQPSDLRLQQWLWKAKNGETGEREAGDPLAASEQTLEMERRRPSSGASVDAEGSANDFGEITQETGIPPPLNGRSRSSGVADMLLADLPPSGFTRAPIPAPSTPSRSEVQRIAESYEQDLRASLEEVKQKPKGFFRRHWLGLTFASTLVIGVTVALVGTRLTKKRYNEKHAKDFLASAEQGLLQDTYPSLSGSLHQMNALLEIDPHRGPALAVAAQAQAMLCHDFNCTSAQRAQAQEWADDPAAKADEEAQLAARVFLAGNPDLFAEEILKIPVQTAGAWEHFLAGNALLVRKNDAEALRRFDLGLKLDPAHVPMLLSVAEYDLQRGETARAADLYALAHQASPFNVGAAVGLAEAHVALREPLDEDEKNLAPLLSAGPETIPLALRQRLDFAEARALAAGGNLTKAVSLLQDGVSQHGDEFVAYEGVLADCYAADGQYDRAESEAWKALSKSQHDPEALARYGEILLAHGRAREVLARVPAVANNRHLRVVRAEAAIDSGNFALARSEIEATRKDNKVPALAGALLAEVEAHEGHADDAKKTLKQIAALAHPPAEAFLALARLEQTSDPKLSVADARRAVGTDDHSYEAHCLLGRLLVKAGAADEATAELTTAIHLNQQHVEARLALATLEMDHGKAKDAQGQLEAAIKEAPQDEAVNLALARNLLALKREGDAIHMAAKATKLAPQDPKAHHWLGKIALAVGDRKLAVKELKTAKKLDKENDRTIGSDLALAEKKKR